MVKHSASRKSRKHTARKSHKRTQKRRQTRRRRHRGGVAPVGYALSGSWPSQTSLGQGGDYLGYHQEQHGGSAPYPGSLAGAPLLSPGLEGASMTTGLTKAMADIAGLSDMPSSSAATAMQAGGRRHRRKRSTKRRSTSTKRRSTKRHSRRHRRRGGALGFAPFNPAATSGMLLSSAAQYDAAGLNPGYISGDVEGVAAAARGDTN